MITAEYIRGHIEEKLAAGGFFLVDVQVKLSKKIVVFADSIKGITLDDCVAITRMIEETIGSGLESYELEVSSPGLENPLKLPVQYRKNTGRLVRIIETGGNTREGNIIAADESKVTLEVAVKMKQAGKKAETMVQHPEIEYKNIKTAKLIIR
jgi:ribosome maturation factor RimP